MAVSGILLILAIFVLPLGFSLAGLLRSASRPLAGALYWTAFGLLAVQLLYVEAVIGVGVFAWGQISSEPMGLFPLFLIPLPVILLLLTANALWVRGQDRRIPADAGEEERTEARGRLKRRLWFPLLAIPLLQIALSFILPAMNRPSRARRVRPTPLGMTSPPTSTSGVATR